MLLCLVFLRLVDYDQWKYQHSILQFITKPTLSGSDFVHLTTYFVYLVKNLT